MTTAILSEEVLEERYELGTAFAIGQKKCHPACQRIQCAKDGRAAILASRRDNALGAYRSPHAAQARIEMELAFVLEDEGAAVRVGGYFFKEIVSSRLARRISFGSCLCLRESFGRL